MASFDTKWSCEKLKSRLKVLQHVVQLKTTSTKIDNCSFKQQKSSSYLCNPATAKAMTYLKRRSGSETSDACCKKRGAVQNSEAILSSRERGSDNPIGRESCVKDPPLSMCMPACLTKDQMCVLDKNQKN